MTIPSGFDLEHVAPVPGWTATVSGQHEENGEMEGGDSITWKGKLERRPSSPCCRSRACRRTTASTRSRCARPTRDGSVVEWSGAESSDTPAARIEAVVER